MTTGSPATGFPVRGARGGLGWLDCWDDPGTDTLFLRRLAAAVRAEQEAAAAAARASLQAPEDDDLEAGRRIPRRCA